MSFQKVTVELEARSTSVMPLRSFSFEILKTQANVETCRAMIRMSAATLKQLRFSVKESSERLTCFSALS
ncbi:hypothetical protein Hypma_002914 [Hypsizygus marmoreus]|uniref:Uncharacterized protein n=1 Tax=Hypsizygus marmoreus TaxID=39966 RepID=A0A369J7H0_HYPMA|nr:hypothetical protein Hypma_002914 [Hypsizygus marmoreus]